MILKRALEKIGSGTYFEIFAIDGENQTIALKCPKLHLKYDARVHQMLENETRVLEALAGEKHFPKLFAKGEESDLPYLLMEKLDGINLDQALKIERSRRERLLPHLAAGIILEVAAGLKVLHSLSIPEVGSVVHGDLKPHNIMVLRNGQVKIVDLGLQGGTFNYLPPERLDSKKIEFATDLFAAGSILFELLSGTAMFPGETKMDVYFQLKDLRREPLAFPSSIPSSLAPIIKRCLSAGLEGGYPDAASLHEDLGAHLAGHLTSASSQRVQWIEQLEIDNHD